MVKTYVHKYTDFLSTSELWYTDLSVNVDQSRDVEHTVLVGDWSAREATADRVQLVITDGAAGGAQAQQNQNQRPSGDQNMLLRLN